MPINTLKGLKIQSEVAIFLLEDPKNKFFKEKLSYAHSLINPKKINILEEYRLAFQLESYVDIDENEFKNWLKGRNYVK